jgi:hypothetical protein
MGKNFPSCRNSDLSTVIASTGLSRRIKENMTMSIAIESAGDRTARWLQAVAAVGVLWNGYGVYQFVGTLASGPDDLMAIGMTSDQVAVYTSLPAWTTIAFAVGVFGGLIGSALLALGRRASFAVLATSAVGYVALFAGDALHGVFKAIPAQFAILTLVVVIAFALLAVAAYAKHRKLLN